jgi:hypothetical protein
MNDEVTRIPEWTNLGRDVMRAADAKGREWTLFPEHSDVARISLTPPPPAGMTKEEAVDAYCAALMKPELRDKTYPRLRMTVSGDDVGHFASQKEGMAILAAIDAMSDEALLAEPSAEKRLRAAGFSDLGENRYVREGTVRFALPLSPKAHSEFTVVIANDHLDLDFEPAHGRFHENLLRINLRTEGGNPTPAALLDENGGPSPLRIAAEMAVIIVEARLAERAAKKAARKATA